MSGLFYMGANMGVEEKRAWIALVVAIVTYFGYAITVLIRADGGPLDADSYKSPFLWWIGISIGASIVLESIAQGSLPKGVRRKDTRDLEIYRTGEYAGHWVLVVGAFLAMVLALTEVGHFWIANVLYLVSTLGAILSAIVRIVSYRKGFPPW
jgi:hypothetical protein